MMSMRIVPAGDSALLVEFPRQIDPAINARCIGLAEALTTRHRAEIRDAVVGYCSVTVYFDPLRVDPLWLEHEIRAAAAEPLEPQSARAAVIDVPVRYGGDFGPDLADVARFGHCSEEEAIARHSAVVYRVYLTGFVPGFAYMATVDPRIAAPRRAMPRTKIAAGSVAIAGGQTGIYPSATPGGWNIIGRTGVRPFDPTRSAPFLFKAGDRVRFVPTSEEPDDRPGDLDASTATAHAVRLEPSRAAVTVIRPGMLTTVQDLGRWGQQARGVPVAGPMDEYSHRIANRLAGNPDDAAALEITLMGPELETDRTVVCAMAGATFDLDLSGTRAPQHAPFEFTAGARLRFRTRTAGTRATLAFRGGILTDAVFGSRATSLISSMGPFGGRALKAGDVLPIALADAVAAAHPPLLPRVLPHGGARLRVIAGPHEHFFTASAFDALFGGRYTVTSSSNRMGYRLDGPPLSHVGSTDILSDATPVGSLQVPASGQPILLMADRQTTGGYPKIATVITADLPAAGQLAPGDWIEFVPCTRVEAVMALAAQRRSLEGRTA